MGPPAAGIRMDTPVVVPDAMAAAAVRTVMRRCPDDAMEMLAMLGLEAR